MTRHQVEDAIEALIVLLDQMDGDADLEDDPSDFEPCLGWTISGGVWTTSYDDLEENEVAA